MKVFHRMPAPLLLLQNQKYPRLNHHCQIYREIQWMIFIWMKKSGSMVLVLVLFVLLVKLNLPLANGLAFN
ncbi:hypothetical protein BLA29_012866 [Euroglyphus maynei]|uniref:Uncharacterized protein n=1 Tax=Euroglyphus maynei TaxID=6958 RepID=A0A1Y3B4L4_EURMA|nr:hypothetical protein BLA29_012866 [Euroglyphus maynei]